MTAVRETRIVFGDVLRFKYTNYKMETEWRKATFVNLWHGSSTYHQGEQWFMRAFDHDRQETRNFAMRDMTEVSIVS